MPLEIMDKLKFDKKNNIYSIIEAGFKYEFPQSLHAGFRIYILRYDFVSRWYKQLEDNDRNKVTRSNAYE
jgi:hypothetical protein